MTTKYRYRELRWHRLPGYIGDSGWQAAVEVLLQRHLGKLLLLLFRFL